MLISNHEDRRLAKNIISINRLPVYIDKEQPPTKKEPFRTICDVPFCHTLECIASKDYALDGLQQALEQAGTLHYARVHMKLLDIVSGSFFDDYIKTGNVLMLSEGRTGVDETYTLREGILRLEVDRPQFERIGLDGKVISNSGRKHVKARYAIDLNLRLPSMVRGKKGFERVLWAFTNVLVSTQTWLFCNLKAPSDMTGPISAHAPVVRQIMPALQYVEVAPIPNFTLDGKSEVEDILEIQEWLSLVALDSSRVKPDDKIDSYLSRYEVPHLTNLGPEAESVKCAEVVRIQWRGLVHADFIKTLYMLLLKSGSSTGWLAISGHAFDRSSYTIIRKDKEVAVCRYMD